MLSDLLRIIHPNIGFHIAPWTADVLDVLSPTNAESAESSIDQIDHRTICNL